MIEVVFHNQNGIITDFGSDLEAKSADGSEFTIPRYGVWKSRDGKVQVVYTTSDLDDAKKELA